MSLLQFRSNRANHSHSKWLTHLILFRYLCDIYPRPQAILLIEQSSQSENSYHVIRSILRLTHNWKLFPDTVNRMFHHFHYECHGLIIIRDFQWQKQLICLTSWHRISSSNTHWKVKRMLLRIFFLLLFLFFSFLFFISLCRIMYTKNIIYFQWNNILVNHLLSLICGYKFGLTVSLTCIPQTATKPTLADILRSYYLPNKWHFEDFCPTWHAI